MCVYYVCGMYVNGHGWHGGMYMYLLVISCIYSVYTHVFMVSVHSCNLTAFVKTLYCKAEVGLDGQYQSFSSLEERERYHHS